MTFFILQKRLAATIHENGGAVASRTDLARTIRANILLPAIHLFRPRFEAIFTV
jgi:hypothetical protein